MLVFYQGFFRVAHKSGEYDSIYIKSRKGRSKEIQWLLGVPREERYEGIQRVIKALSVSLL